MAPIVPVAADERGPAQRGTAGELHPGARKSRWVADPQIRSVALNGEPAKTQLDAMFGQGVGTPARFPCGMVLCCAWLNI